MKYHNVHNEPFTISADLVETKNIYQSLEQKQKQCEATSMEINVVSLVRKLREMNIRPPTKKIPQIKSTSKSSWIQENLNFKDK